MGRAYSGVDQYQNIARHRVLCSGDSNRACASSHGEEYNAAGVRRLKYLQGGPIPKTTFAYETPVLNLCSSTGGEYGRFCNRTLGLHEREEEILASAYHHGAGTSRRSDCSDPRISSGAIHLYPLLKVSGLSVVGDQRTQ